MPDSRTSSSPTNTWPARHGLDNRRRKGLAADAAANVGCAGDRIFQRLVNRRHHGVANLLHNRVPLFVANPSLAMIEPARSERMSP